MPNSVSCNGEIRLSLHLWFETAPPRPIHPDCHTGLPLAPAPLDGFHQDYSSCSMALYMSRVYHPRGMVSTGMEKALRIDRPDGRRVRKFDGLSGRGWWWRLTPQILKSTSLSSFLPAHPPFRGWVASAASRKGAAVWAALRPGFRWFRGCGGGFALGHTFGVRVQKVQGRAFGPRVQKVHRAGIRVLRMDGPSAQGFLSLTGPLAPRVADCPSGNAYKVSVTRFTLYVYRAACRSALQWCYIGRAAWRWEISRLRFASLEMTGRKRSRLSATRCPLTMGKKGRFEN